MALSNAQLNAIIARNTVNGQVDERAVYYDKISAQNAIQSGSYPIIPSNTNSNVVSAPKSSSSGDTKTAAQIKQEKQDAANAKLASQIKDSFSSTINNYKNQISRLPGQQEDSMEQIGNLANTQNKSINDALSAALAKFTGYRGEVATNQKNTLQDLADNTRNMFMSGNNYLGSLGASNSSATGMYSAAMTQQANRQRADVQGQSNQQYNSLNEAEADVNTQAQDSLNQVQTWKATQEATIVSQYQELKRQLETAYANAKDDQKGAIANLSMQLADQARASLSNINNVAAQYQQQLAASLGQASQQDYTRGVDTLGTEAAGNVQQQTYSLNGMQIQEGPADAQSSEAGGYVGTINGTRVKSDDGYNWTLV